MKRRIFLLILQQVFSHFSEPTFLFERGILDVFTITFYAIMIAIIHAVIQEYGIDVSFSVLYIHPILEIFPRELEKMSFYRHLRRRFVVTFFVIQYRTLKQKSISLSLDNLANRQKISNQRTMHYANN